MTPEDANLAGDVPGQADATAEQIAELGRLAQARSPVFDIVSKPVPVMLTAVKK
jgi:hypothetical protein